MKKFIYILFSIFLVIALAACGGNNNPASSGSINVDTAPDAKFDLDIIGGNYKVVYDLSDPNAVSLMTGMVSKINTASGVKLSSSNSNNPESEYEIQLGLKSGRSEAETVYNIIKEYGNDEYSAYSIRAVGNKVVISASSKEALEVAADRFAAMASSVFVIASDFNETAIFKTEEYKYGNLNLIYFDEFGTSTEVVLITANGKDIKVYDGKKRLRYSYKRRKSGGYQRNHQISRHKG